MTRKTTSLAGIMSAAAEHFDVQEVDLHANGEKTDAMNLARLSTIFVAARADYSNADIAEAMGYKSANTVSSKFAKAMKSYQNFQTHEDEVFVSNVRALAKHAHVTLD